MKEKKRKERKGRKERREEKERKGRGGEGSKDLACLAIREAAIKPGTLGFGLGAAPTEEGRQGLSWCTKSCAVTALV